MTQQLAQQQTEPQYTPVERSTGVFGATRSWCGTQWYHVAEDGAVKRFSHYENACGHKLYRDGKPWGEWKDVSQDKLLYVYAGEEGLGVYDADGRLQRALSRVPGENGIVNSDVRDSNGRWVYHRDSGSFYDADGSHREAILVLGPPPGTENVDPTASVTPPYEYDSQPSPSDRVVPYEEYSPAPEQLVETQFKSVQADVIVGERLDRCGRRCLQIERGQKVWEAPADAATLEGRPSILITEAELAEASEQDGYKIVSNEHGVFRVKDGVVERQAVVDRETWRTCHTECRCVPVRGCFGRVRYQRQAVYVEQSHSAVRLGWVDDPAVGIEQTPKEQPDNGRRPGDGPSYGPGVDPFAQPAEGSSRPFGNTPAEEEGFSPVETPAIEEDLPLSGSPDSQSPLPSSADTVDPFGPIALPLEADIEAQSDEAPLRFPEREQTESPSMSPEEVEREPAAAPQETAPFIEPAGAAPVEESSEGSAEPEDEQRGSALDPLPLEDERPSIQDAPDGDPNRMRAFPWTPPRAQEEIEPEEVERKETETPRVAEFQLDQIRLPERPLQAREVQTVLEMVAILGQLETFAQFADEATKFPAGHPARLRYFDVVTNPAVNPFAYDRLFASTVGLSAGREQSKEAGWLKPIQDSLEGGLNTVNNLNRGDAEQLYGVVFDNLDTTKGALEELFDGQVDLFRLMDAIDTSEEMRHLHERFPQQIERLRDYQQRRTWESEEEPLPQPQPGRAAPGLPSIA